MKNQRNVQQFVKEVYVLMYMTWTCDVLVLVCRQGLWDNLVT